MSNQPDEHRELKVTLTSRKMSPTELRFARASEDARRSRGREHYRNVSIQEAERLRDDLTDKKRPDRMLVSQVRFPRIDIRASRIERVDFSEVDLEDVRFKPPPLRKPITLSDCVFRDVVLHGAFHDLAFESVVFDRCVLTQVQVRRSSLRDCRFLNCTFSDVRFESCDVNDVAMEVNAHSIGLDSCALHQFRLAGSARMGVIGGCKCDRVDVSRCAFTDFTFVQNTGRIDFPTTRNAFVVPEEGVLEARKALEPQISPRSLRVFDKTVVPSSFVGILASELREAPERDLILDTLYAHHVDHS